jgi:hypothetical protein
MTSQGSAHGRNLLNAEIAAREIGELSLPDALAFCLLLAEVDPLRFDIERSQGGTLVSSLLLPA